ncbi:MAG: FecR domain-containing protein [Spirochaetales bacterium]|nr:FecR domain-containing protein [Spirochaetales bacterium]
MKLNKLFLFLSILVFTVTSVFSVDLTATIRELNGKVEYKKDGGTWTTASVGDVLNSGDSISTGFNSKAVMVLGDTSVLVANDLTRLTLSELYQKEGTVVTDLFLDVGNVRTQVHSSDKVANDFTVRNANSTASVRGTVLDVDIMGDGKGMKVMAWDGMAVVTDTKTGRKAQVGESKKDSGEEKGEEESSEEEGEDDGGSSDDTASEMADPPEPPAAVAAAPVLASGTGGGMVSSMSTAISSTTVSASTKPAPPSAISTGGGVTVSTNAASVVAAASASPATPETVKTPTTSDVSITVSWPDE